MEKDYQSTIQTLKGDNEELMKEVSSLKRKIGGYQTANENYRKQVAELKARVEHYKALDIEGDHLYESEIGKKQELLDSLKESNRNIDSLTLLIADLRETIANKDNKIKELEQENDGLSKALEYEQTPWWKKLF